MNTPRPIKTAPPVKGRIRFQRRVHQMREAQDEIAQYRKAVEQQRKGV